MAADDQKPVQPKPAPPPEGQPQQGQPQQGQAQQGQKPPDQKPKKPSPFKNPLVLLIGAAVLVVVIIAALLWWLQARRWVNTDDAYIDTKIVHLAPQVAGSVNHIYVGDNVLVQPGQVLLDIEPSSARASLQQAQGQVGQAGASVEQAQTQIAANTATWRQSRADADAAAAQAVQAEDDLRRYLTAQRIAAGSVSQQQVDQARATARNLEAQRRSALEKAQNAADQIATAQAQLKAAQQQQRALQGQAQQAQINLGNTRLFSPVAGHVANRTVALGDYVQPGQEVMAIVPLNVWITANYKETQLANMRVGQKVEVKIDACPHTKVRAHVDSIQRGAGQAFGILPAQNATGNFVKVVQRVPVKIVFDTLPRDCPLGPGMSVRPKVLVRP
ncbi:MAG TPA: HlyD family secretion protein [Caulobacteraceae bacterium]|jgi:membrane fusion protein (multidrug efflux system)|nr:HlyD family secretion protein [Caulobacteraceae bacterium]